MKLLLVLLCCLAAPLQGQEPPLEAVAREAAAHWQRHDAQALVSGSPQLIVQLPDTDPSAPVSRDQAAELLRGFFRRSTEVETRVVNLREMAGGRGFAELERAFRVAGTQDVRRQRILLSYRRGGQGWTLMELRVTR